MIRQVSIIICCLFWISLSMQGQGLSVEDIKRKTDLYIWGEGQGATHKSADDAALADLISQISVAVSSRFEQEIVEMRQDGPKKSDATFQELVRSIVTTYSTATLHSAERITMQNEPNAKVLRYIEKASIPLVFEQRKEKIHSFTQLADRFYLDRQLADALRYYYWALTLLRSHPDGGKLKYRVGNNESFYLSYLPERINHILARIKCSVYEIKDKPGKREVSLRMTFEGQPIVNLEYSFWNGKDWSPLISAKDGWAYVEFFGENARQWESIDVKVEYSYQGELWGDHELREVMMKLEPVHFKQASLKVMLTSQQDDVSEPKAANPEVSASLSPADAEPYRKIVQDVINSLDNSLMENISAAFTPGGYEVFEDLLVYGRAKLISQQDIRAIRYNNTTIVRGPILSFSFPNNQRRFVEDIVFHFNDQGKIETLSFGLERDALSSILQNQTWTEYERLTLINFLEHYKTAYALKRLDYIKSIFDDDALIIVGNVVKVKQVPESPYANHQIVKYNRYSKHQYMMNLEHCFRSNEFINVKFEESNLRKGGKNGDLFGVQIKQQYYSSTYSDVGYLFLMIDFKNVNEPLIHVRTWQPEKDSEGKIYGLESFN